MLVVTMGPMFSGKTSQLIAFTELLTRLGRTWVAFKYDKDRRYQDGAMSEIVSHDGKRINAVPIGNWSQIEDYVCYLEHKWGKRPGYILIDEAQFIFGARSACMKTQHFTRHNHYYYVYGLDQWADGMPCERMSVLASFANDVRKNKTVCKICHSKEATMTYKHSGSGKREEIGGEELYWPVCPVCWYNLMGEKQ